LFSFFTNLKKGRQPIEIYNGSGGTTSLNSKSRKINDLRDFVLVRDDACLPVV
jgi:hypothetical protein